MYLLFTDETNAEPTNEGKFFVFGGIILETQYLADINEKIKAIRKEAGFKNKNLFKFDTHTRPSYVSKDKFNAAKEQILNVCTKYNINFIVYLIHHNIADKNLKIESAINHITSGFNKYLKENKSIGICFYDRMPKIDNQFNLLKDNFSEGLKFKDGKRIALENIILHSITCAGSSNLYSAVDIVLGSFRYCINNPKNKKIASSMLKKISNMVWGERKDGNVYCIGKGIILRPKKPIAKYKDDYQELIKNINDLLNLTS